MSARITKAMRERAEEVSRKLEPSKPCQFMAHCKNMSDGSYLIRISLLNPQAMRLCTVCRNVIEMAGLGLTRVTDE